jgi:hypothetical protein
MNDINKKRIFWESWTGRDWAYFIIWLIIAIAFRSAMEVIFNISKEWAMAIFLIPVAIGVNIYLRNKK